MNFIRAAVIALILVSMSQASAADRLIFLIVGQSNASGSGDQPPPAYSNAHRIQVYANSGRWRAGYEPVDEPAGQVDKVSMDQATGVGFGMAFAQRLTELKPDIEVGLVPCAKGGSTMRTWARSWSRSTLYGSCLARAIEAREAGRIAGILFWQGEADTLKAATAHPWGANFAALVGGFRVDLGDLNLPVAVATLSNLRATANWRIVRTQQFALSAAPQVRVVSTNGIQWEPDGVHATTHGQQIVGKKMAETMVNLLQ